MVFQKNYGRFPKGDQGEIVEANERGLILLKSERRSEVSYKYAERFTLAKPVDLEISPGDKLQLKASGKSAEGLKFSNGELVTVDRVGADGTIVVVSERGEMRSLMPHQRQLVRGYAVTSYASQGKTVDAVIVADSGNRAATNSQQWYVSISRGRRKIEISLRTLNGCAKISSGMAPAKVPRKLKLDLHGSESHTRSSGTRGTNLS